VELLSQIAESLIDGDEAQVARLTLAALTQGVAAKQILDGGLIAGMDVIGRRFKAHEIFLPDVLLAAKAMYAGLDQLKPLLAQQGAAGRGRVVIGSVQGDLHDIGKNLVGIMLKGAGFDVFDLGHDVSPERFVAAAQEHQATIIGMSALLTTTMPAMKTLVDLLHQRGLNGQIKTIVGGAPVSAEFAQEIGASAYGFDAASAVDRVKDLLGVR
jgi:5-methyltetrahydrofolate--homocysteine methyltransferase